MGRAVVSSQDLMGSAAGESTQGNHCEDVHRLLPMLRTCVARIEPDTDLERLVSRLSEAVERMSVEHAGMAEELLCAYEQLGVVFEVTRKLPTVQTEAEVIELFVANLQRSFPKREVFFVHPSAVGESDRGAPEHETVPSAKRLRPPQEVDITCESRAEPGEELQGGVFGGRCPPYPWIETAIRRARDRGTVLVECAPQPPEQSEVGLADGDHIEGVAEAMVGPVSAGAQVSTRCPTGGYVGAIVLTRKTKGEAFRAGDMLLLESLTTFCSDLIRAHRLVRELREMSMAMVRSLVNAVDQKDPYTSGHSLRVGYFATLLGQELGLESADLQMLEWSALLHDIGKIGIRDQVLNKRGSLTEEEFNHIREHPVRSHEVVQDVPQLAGALDGVLHHHERYDGTGYPSGISGDDIPLQARIIQIADIFDALTSDRSYRGARDWRQALNILEQEAGTTVDPNLRSVFDALIRGRIEGDPDGWLDLVRRANRFTQVDGEPEVLTCADPPKPRPAARRLASERSGRAARKSGSEG